MSHKVKKRIGLLGIAHDDNSSYRPGSAKAPPKIREALFCPSGNLWGENGEKLDFEGKILDRGDIKLNGDPEAFPKIQAEITRMINCGLLPVLLGGDHSITYPVVKTLAEHFPEITVLQFDAHPDLYDNFMDNPYSHACPFARIMENSHARRLVQVGIRTFTGHQREQAQRFRVESREMKDFSTDLDLSITGNLYLSIDLDVLDPSHAPGVSHVEPGGLSPRELINLLHRIEAVQIIGADLVEYNPDQDPSGITAFTAAKILKEMLAKIQAGLH